MPVSIKHTFGEWKLDAGDIELIIQALRIIQPSHSINQALRSGELALSFENILALEIVPKKILKFRSEKA